MSTASKQLQLLSIQTFVIRCYYCKRWVGRVPQWDNGELGKGWQCDCGSTSTTMKEGRPFGPRYRYWTTLEDEFNDFARLGMLKGVSGKWLLETVKVKQPVHCSDCVVIDKELEKGFEWCACDCHEL